MGFEIFCGNKFLRVTSFDKFCKQRLFRLTGFQNIENYKNRRNFCYHVVVAFFVFAIHLIMLEITTITSTTSSSIFIKS